MRRASPLASGRALDSHPLLASIMLSMRGERTKHQSRYDALPRLARLRRAAPVGAPRHGCSLAKEPKRGLKPVEEGEHVTAREHYREVIGAKEALQALQGEHLQFEDAPVPEDERAEGLVLGGRRDPTLHGEVVQEGGRLGGAPSPGVAACVETDERADPVVVGFFRARRFVQAAERGPHGLDEGHGHAPGRCRASAFWCSEEISMRSAEELRGWCQFSVEEGRHPWKGRSTHVAIGPERPNRRLVEYGRGLIRDMAAAYCLEKWNMAAAAVDCEVSHTKDMTARTRRQHDAGRGRRPNVP